MDGAELQKEVEGVRNSLDAQLETSSLCLADGARHPRDAILNRKYAYRDALLALVWPCLMLGGGALLVGLVKLTQHLARLSSEMCSGSGVGGGSGGAEGGRLTWTHVRGKLNMSPSRCNNPVSS